jgi:hypothetical protein
MDKLVLIKAELQRVKSLRKTLLSSVQEVVNLRNRLTFLSNDALQKAVGVDVKSSRLTFRLHDRISEVKESMAGVVTELNEACLALSVLAKEEHSIDAQFLQKLINDIEQQVLLETAISDKILAEDSHLIDQDSIVTMIACFEFPPYLDESNMEAILLQ